MFIPLIPFAVSAVSAGTALYILSKHWEKLRLFDPDSLKEEQHRQKRLELIHRRFERVRSEQMQPFKRIGRHLGKMASESYEQLYRRLQAFEAVYKNVKNPLATLAPTSRERIKSLLSEGRSLARDLKYADAERRFLEILSLDARQADAYKGLGQIYLKQKLYPQARETYEFLVKIKKVDDSVFAGLAEICEAEGNLPQAENFYVKAIQANPRQACRYAELAQFYLERDQREKAWEEIEQAIALEKNSLKYLEMGLDIALTTKRAPEARRYYDRLRLTSDDQTKVQGWREKLEVLEREAGKKAPLTKKR